MGYIGRLFPLLDGKNVVIGNNLPMAQVYFLNQY